MFACLCYSWCIRELANLPNWHNASISGADWSCSARVRSMSTEISSRREADLPMVPQNLGVDESIPWNHSLLACLLPGEPLQPPPLTQRHTNPWTAGGPGTEGRALRLMPRPPRAHVCMHCKPYSPSYTSAYMLQHLQPALLINTTPART